MHNKHYVGADNLSGQQKTSMCGSTCAYTKRSAFVFSELRSELSPVTCKQLRILFCYEFYRLKDWVDGAIDADPVLTPQGGINVAQSRAQGIPHPVRKWPPFFPTSCLYRYVADETFPLKLASGRKRESIPKCTLMLWSHPAGQNKVCGCIVQNQCQCSDGSDGSWCCADNRLQRRSRHPV